jgi:Na+/H+ antiporter NhaD/arsenite permease-like protein
MIISTAIVLIFLAGYSAIITEQKIRINKTASALITGALAWTVFIVFSSDKGSVLHQIEEHIANISGVLFFLMGAMTIVEIVDSHDGFDVITQRITTRNKRVLLWIFGLVTFFLSSVLDNLTTTIVMISLLRKLVRNEWGRWYFTGIIVIAANAGGTWSPIGDVTTTMLWIGKQISTYTIIQRMFLPGLTCLLVPLIIMTFLLKPDMDDMDMKDISNNKPGAFQKNLVFIAGMAALLFVPFFKSITDLPPFMAMIFALGLMWLLTEIVHRKKPEEEKGAFSVAFALRRIDTPTILFFLGILLCISALQSSGVLMHWADFLMKNMPGQSSTVLSIGLISAVIDNVPLVAAVQGMYPLSVYPTDHFFWEFLAYTSGTGGSILIIGSASGVAAMGMERISFFWYLKRVAFLALCGYFAGAIVYMLVF